MPEYSTAPERSPDVYESASIPLSLVALDNLETRALWIEEVWPNLDDIDPDEAEALRAELADITRILDAHDRSCYPDPQHPPRAKEDQS